MDDFSIVIKTRFNDVLANAILDSGAGASVMDLGTFESLKLEQTLENSNDILHDASGNEMNIVGIAKIKVHVAGTNTDIVHDFRILNSRSYRNVILGRDLMKKFKVVTFDFKSNVISLDGRRVKGVTSPSKRLPV